MRCAFGLAALLFVGCASSSHIVVGKTRTPISPSQVKLYLSPPTNFEEVAILNASSKHSWAMTDQRKVDKAIERLKVEAGKLGANGVLLREAGDQYGGSIYTDSATATTYGNTTYGFGTGTSVPIIYKSAVGVAIYVTLADVNTANTTNNISNPEVVELCAALGSSNPNEVVHTLKLLRRPDAAAAVPDILPLLHNNNTHVVRDACRTLAVIANKDVIPSIEPLLKDKRSDVRKDAQDAIEKLQAKP